MRELESHACSHLDELLTRVAPSLEGQGDGQRMLIVQSRYGVLGISDACRLQESDQETKVVHVRFESQVHTL